MNWKKIAKVVGAVVLLVGGFVLTIAANQSRINTPTQNINVLFSNPAIQFINQNDVYEIVKNDLDTLKGLNLKEVDLKALENEVRSNNYVENCEAFINNKNELSFRIQQKQPLFRVLHENGVSYYVDNAGLKFSKSPKFTANVPIATGKIIYQVDSLNTQTGNAINDLVKLFAYADEHETVKALITSVDVRENGDLVITPRMGKHLVNIGSPTNLDDKFNRLIVFYNQGLNKIGWEQYAEINLKFNNQIIAKKKKL